jgi:TrkA domain protein
LTDDEARKFGSIMAGSDYQPVTDERLELLLNNLFVEWLKVGENSLFANFTIRETRMKNVFDVTIIGIQRGEDIIGSPSADEMILPGDLLMVVGKREKIKNLEHLCLQEKLCQISAGWKA